MSTTIFLRFPDEATFLSLMPADFVANGETGSPLPDAITAISIIGTLLTGYHVNALAAQWTPDVLDADGNVITPGTPILPAGWDQYFVSPDPATPWRVFG